MAFVPTFSQRIGTAALLDGKLDHDKYPPQSKTVETIFPSTSHRLSLQQWSAGTKNCIEVSYSWICFAFSVMFDVKGQNEETHFVGTAFSVIIFHITKCYFIWLLSDCGCLSWLVRPWDNDPWKISSRVAFFGEIPGTTFPLVQDSTYNMLGSEKNDLQNRAVDSYWFPLGISMYFTMFFSFWPTRTFFLLPWPHIICWFSWVLSWWARI